jgi:hypothetical protein
VPGLRHPLAGYVEKLLPQVFVLGHSSKPHALARVAHTLLIGHGHGVPRSAWMMAIESRYCPMGQEFLPVPDSTEPKLGPSVDFKLGPKITRATMLLTLRPGVVANESPAAGGGAP